MDATPVTDAEIATLQGNILRGYRLPHVRHFILGVTNRTTARQFLGATIDGTDPAVPQITTERRIAPASGRMQTAFNLGFTFHGLRALGLAPSDLESFPTEFTEGMTRRAAKLGDFDASDPRHWPAPYDAPESVHLVATAYAAGKDWLDSLGLRLAKSFALLGQHDGRALPDDKVFFGYKDGLSQPRYIGFHNQAPARGPSAMTTEPSDPLGTMLLGQPTRLPGLYFAVPSPAPLGYLGTFNAFRVLQQDTFGFEDFLTRTAEALQQTGISARLVGLEHARLVYPELDGIAALREVVAAQMCGRWRNGVPMQTAGKRDPQAQPDNDFDYDAGALCPVGAHIRRTNPRGGEIVQRIANFTRRLARRGMSYGPDFDPATPDTHERGLLGNFLCASLGAQFEAVTCDWLNLGLHAPDITGSNDPLLGANTPETSWFDLNIWRDGDGSVIDQHRIYGLPRFVTTRGGAYTFLPTVTGIAYLATLQD